MRNVIYGLLAAAALGGAYYLGTLSQSKASSNAAAPTAPTVTSEAIEDQLIVPTGLTIPDKLPAMTIEEPAKILAGEMKIPTDLLRTEPPANPNFVVPQLSK